jgi:hypothetical protein
MQPSVTIQTSPEPVPAVPPWFGEVAAFAQVLTHTGILKTIQEQVRFARARFGHYGVTISFRAKHTLRDRTACRVRS